MSSHLHVNTCSTLVQWESHTLSTPTSDNSPSFPKSKERWYSQKDLSDMSPNFLFYRAYFIITWWNWTIPLKIHDEDCWNLHLVEQVSFCKKFGILQPCAQCPGQYLASWHSHCEYGVVLVLPLLSLISGILGQDRSTTSGVGRLSG